MHGHRVAHSQRAVRGLFVLLLIIAALLINAMIASTLGGQMHAATPPQAIASSNIPETSPLFLHPQVGQWAVGSGVGVLGETPDGLALAWNGHADYFITDRVSVGPLLQLAFTDELTQVALSGQLKHRLAQLDGGRGAVTLQGGMGVVHADVRRGDTSWIVPLGVGMEYALSPRATLTSTFLVNFTDVDPGAGREADVMPGVTIGMQF